MDLEPVFRLEVDSFHQELHQAPFAVVVDHLKSFGHFRAKLLDALQAFSFKNTSRS